MKACIVTGTRHGRERDWFDRIKEALTSYDIVIEGGQVRFNDDLREYTGIDWLAGRVARSLGKEHRKRPADWNQYRKAAGPIRNQKMLEELMGLQSEGYEIAVLAFHHDLDHATGTGDMVRRAKAAGVSVEEFA